MTIFSWRPLGALTVLIVASLLAACAQDAGAGNQPANQAEQPPGASTDQPVPADSTPEPADPGGGPATTPSPTQAADPYDAALAYARCIRENGYEHWPDPEPDGRIMVRRDQGMSMNDPHRIAAMEACQALRPPGAGQGGLGPGVGQGGLDQEALLEFARCMRANGVPEFPDPDSAGGPMIIGGDSGIDPNSPAFRSALEVCQAQLFQP